MISFFYDSWKSPLTHQLFLTNDDDDDADGPNDDEF